MYDQSLVSPTDSLSPCLLLFSLVYIAVKHWRWLVKEYFTMLIVLIIFFLGDYEFPGRDPLSSYTPPQPLPASDQGDYCQLAAPRYGLSLPRCKERRMSPP